MMILKIVSLLVRLWVEISRKRNHWRTALSASLWGCELKWIIQNTKETGERVSLLVRLWVEISFPSYPGVIESSQPPCEAVSWNSYASGGMRAYDVSLLVRLWVEITDYSRNNPLYLVSLLVRLWVEISRSENNCVNDFVSLLVRLWVEISTISVTVLNVCVSLLVRLWVEIHLMHIQHNTMHRQPPCEGVSWNDSNGIGLLTDTVSLLVRLWVEI